MSPTGSSSMFHATLDRRFSILAATVCLLCLTSLTIAREEAPEAEEADSVVEGVRCISSRPIRRTEVLDDETILFYLRGATIYLNHLPKPCKRLAKAGRFMYRTTIARLCRSDQFNILIDAGSGLAAGRTCKLGSFYRITKEDVADLKKPRAVAPKPIPPAAPEEPGTEQTVESEQTEQDEPSETAQQ